MVIILQYFSFISNRSTPGTIRRDALYPGAICHHYDMQKPAWMAGLSAIAGVSAHPELG